MPKIEELKVVLDEFNSIYPRPNMDKLELSQSFDIRKDFETFYPGTGFPGVYIISKENGEILRIGKSSCNSSLDKRLSTYYKWSKTENIGVARYAGYSDAFIINTIIVPKNRAFEAPAIEEYLIGELNPPFNTVGLSD